MHGLSAVAAPDVVNDALERVRFVGDEGWVSKQRGVAISQQQAVAQLHWKMLQYCTV